MKVYCDSDDCRYYKDKECTLSNISISCGECDDYVELPEEILFPDIFYKRYGPDAILEGKQEWEQSRGKKITLLDREMFNRGGYITDGRTGILICNEECIKSVEANAEKYLAGLIKAENNGISPLYDMSQK